MEQTNLTVENSTSKANDLTDKPDERKANDLTDKPEDKPEEHKANDLTDKSSLMKKILSAYKYINDDSNVPIWQKTEKEVRRDISQSKYTIDMNNILQQAIEMKKANCDEIIWKKVDLLADTVNMGFAYMIKSLDENLPVSELPSMHRFKLICHILKITPDNKLLPIFEYFINDEFTKDIKLKSPPYYLRTSLTIVEIREHIHERLPKIKEMITLLIKSSIIKTKIINTIPIDEIDQFIANHIAEYNQKNTIDLSQYVK